MNFPENIQAEMRAPRTAQVNRATRETTVEVSLNLDGSGETTIETGVPFFDHMLDALGRHATFDLIVRAQGDLEIDDHHTVEDVGIVLGQALREALGDMRGITRFGDVVVTMDEVLVLAAIDISGRGQLHYNLDMPVELIGTFDTTLVKEFFLAFSANAGLTLHLYEFAGENAHHLAECAFKATARALRNAVAYDARITGVPSTKGSL